MLRGMNVFEEASRLERQLEDLARRWERFFSRDRDVPLPPEKERGALESRLLTLSRTETTLAAEHFRVEQLLHRFTTYNALWQRQLREREGQPTGAAGRRPNAAAPAHVRDEVQELWQGFVEAQRRLHGDATVTAERFREALERQRQQLEAQGSNVDGFELVEEGGRVKIRARLRRGRQ